MFYGVGLLVVCVLGVDTITKQALKAKKKKMGLFLSLSSILGKSKSEVEKTLNEYLISKSNRLEIKTINQLNDNSCIIGEGQNGITILYPYNFMEWEEVSNFISKKLNCPTFSFHIHDGDLWMYSLYKNGNLVDKFNPIPDYWDENISQKEIEAQKGNSKLISELINNIKAKDILNYLVRWNLKAEKKKHIQVINMQMKNGS